MSIDRPQFGGWYPLDKDTIKKKVDRNWDGVYRIRIRRKKRGSEAIPGIKSEQIIKIGSSHGRILGYSGIHVRLRAHLESNWRINECMREVRDSYYLEFSIKVTASEDARSYEKQALNRYEKEFGELPLCNSRRS